MHIKGTISTNKGFFLSESLEGSVHVTKRSKPRPSITITFYCLLEIFKCMSNAVMAEDLVLFFVCVMAEGSALGIHRVP